MANIYVRLNFDPIGGANTAAGVSYDNSSSSLSANNVQDAIDELDDDVQGEISRATAAESVLDGKIIQEIADRIADVNAEEAARIAADALLIPLTQKGQPNGVATLDGSGLVPSAQLPSYVDDVLEFPTFSAFPAVGETGKIYIAQDTNFQYRWSGSAYFQLSVSPVSSVFGRIGAVVAENGDYTASQITNVPSGNLAATEVQGALNELQTDVDTRATSAALSQEIADRIAGDSNLQSQVDLKASEADLQSEITRATTAEGVLDDKIDQEISDRASADTNLQNQINLKASQADLNAEISRATAAEELVQDNLDAHIASTTAHTAANIVNVPSGNLTATNLQAAVNELQSQIDNTVSGVSSVFGRTGAVVATAGDYDATEVSFDGTASGLTATEVQGAIDELAARPTGAEGDIQVTTFTLASNATDANITDLVFAPEIRSFEIMASVVTTGPDTFEEVKISGIKRTSDYQISIRSTGDETGVTFDCTSGQITYTSQTFTTGTISFRALVTR